MATIHSKLDGDILFTNRKVGGDISHTPFRIDGDVEKSLGLVSEWGSIAGDIINQTDLMDELSNKANLNDIPVQVSDLTNDAGYITGISSTDVTTALGYTPADYNKVGKINQFNTASQYPILTIINDVDYGNGVKWLVFTLGDGTPDGRLVSVPNMDGMNTIAQQVTAMIPTDNAQLNNGAGYTSDSALTTADIDEVCV